MGMLLDEVKLLCISPSPPNAELEEKAKLPVEFGRHDESYKGFTKDIDVVGATISHQGIETGTVLAPWSCEVLIEDTDVDDGRNGVNEELLKGMKEASGAALSSNDSEDDGMGRNADVCDVEELEDRLENTGAASSPAEKDADRSAARVLLGACSGQCTETSPNSHVQVLVKAYGSSFHGDTKRYPLCACDVGASSTEDINIGFCTDIPNSVSEKVDP